MVRFNEGFKEMINKSKRYLKAAKKTILNSNMLLSKNPETILQRDWPSYFKTAYDTHVVSIDGKKFIDMTCLVGQNTLGYRNKELNQYLKKIIDQGNMSSLNCPEEVDLTKILLDLHRWADMAKYTRSGGEANAMAIRIARCYSKNQNVAICGYHGWHDWYLAANLKNKNQLKKHLFGNLASRGVHKNLKNTVFQFNYGNLSELKKITKKNNIGIVKMEVCRNKLPDINFLKEVRNFTKKNNIVLIFDECTTGFRYNLGGVHLITGINPDLAIFGKAIGNGYAINAIIGKKKNYGCCKRFFHQ